MKRAYAVGLILVSIACGSMAAAERPFTFESVQSVGDMLSMIRSKLPLGTSRAAMRHVFVKQGHATLKLRPGDSTVEKYIYDIDLCHYYTWRWNISADYDGGNRLIQAYVNGLIVFKDGKPKKIVPKVAEAGKRASMYRAHRSRPEAYKGESQLTFVLFDRDSDLKTVDDQTLIGAGPSRPDPTNMGRIIVYSDVDPWRSIFDSDAAERVVPYRGNCREVDQRMHAKHP